MDVIKFNQPYKTKDSILILGGFEAIHNGHKKLIDKAREFKKPISLMLITNKDFITHEKNKIQTLDDTLQDLANLNIDLVILVELNQKIASLDGEEFIDIIKKQANANITISGKDFKVGKNRGLAAKDIKGNILVDTYKFNNKKISSTILKEMIQMGHVNDIKKLTPFPYSKTVNVNADKKIKINNLINLQSGIYAAWAIVNDIKYWSILKVNLDGTEELLTPQINIYNQSFVAKLVLEKQIRVIIKKEMENITHQDKVHAINYLKSIK